MIVQKHDFPDIIILWHDMFVLCWNILVSTLLYWGVLYNPFGFKNFITKTRHTSSIAFLYYLTVRERHKDFNKSNNSFHELRVSVFHCAFFSFLSQLELYFNFFFFHASTVVYLVSCALLLLCSCQAYPRDCVCHLCKAVSCGRSSSCDSISCQPLGFLIINTITLQFENSKVFLTKS